MTVIVQLQGLDVKAGTEDIRDFFGSLLIPHGGVCIVGGSLREAFIAFSTEKDAQLAMRHNGNFLKGSMVTLHISSMAELEDKLDSLIKKITPQRTVNKPRSRPDADLPSWNTLPHDHNDTKPSPSTTRPSDPRTANLAQCPNPIDTNLQTSAVDSLDSNTAFLLGICTVFQELQSSHQREHETEPRADFSKADSTFVASDVVGTPEENLNSEPSYVRLFGLPASATKEDICQFFRGLAVEEAIVNVKLGLGYGCLVKFANAQDARDALRFNQRSLGSICVEVRGATEKLWTSALQECESAFGAGDSAKPHPISLETVKHKQKCASVWQIERRSINQLLYKSPKKPKLNCDSANTSSPKTDYIIMVRHLPKTTTKTEIKHLFQCPNIPHKNVLHLLDKEGNRTDTAFLIFNCIEDYNYSMNLNGCHVGSNTIEVLSITEKMMRDMLSKTHPRNLKHQVYTEMKPNRKRKFNPFETLDKTPSTVSNSDAQTCLFIRNLPENVRRSNIKRLFYKYKLKNKNIVLLHDGDGKGSGEAVVQFKSHKLAALAQRLHGQCFLGTQVLLNLISVKQMEDILARGVRRKLKL